MNKKPFFLHLETTGFTLLLIECFCAVLYILTMLIINDERLAWAGLQDLHWVLIYFVGLPAFLMWQCKIDPCAPQKIRQHYFWGRTNETWRSEEGQISFWIAKILNGKFSSFYVNNMPSPGQKIVSNLFARKDDDSDDAGFDVQFAGGVDNAGQPNTKTRVNGRIKATMDFRIIDVIALLAQIIKKSPNVVELDWTDGKLQELAEELFVRLHVLPELRASCVKSPYQDVTKETITRLMETSVNDHVGDDDQNDSINAKILPDGLEIEELTISDVQITDEAALAAMSRAAQEGVQQTQEMANLASFKQQLEETVKMLRDSGFAANLSGEAREAAIADEAVRIVKLNNGLQSPGGAALEELIAGFRSGKK